MKKLLKKVKYYILDSFLGSLKVLLSAAAPSGITLVKAKAVFKLSIPFNISLYILGLAGWLEANAVYVLFVSVAVFFDWLLGVWKHWAYLNDFSFKEMFKGLISKFLIVLAIGFIGEGLNVLTLGYAEIIRFIVAGLKLAVFMYPVSSIFRSITVINGGKPFLFQVWVEMLLKRFNLPNK